ncbi:hypothetical protein PMAYCL1PPCAC_21395, partial [Pristionchus mayeri]
WTSHIFCTTQLQPPTGDGCDSFNDDTDDGICYQVRSNAQTWQDAQTTCRNLGATVASVHNAQENQFIRKAAVNQGAVNGVYLGATGTNNQYKWIDGTPWDYKNFFPGFPVSGHGDCLAMDTFSSSGEWMNMDCSSRMGVACTKKAEPRHECTAGPWKEGQVIYSPGYPYDASEPCDYFNFCRSLKESPSRGSSYRGHHLLRPPRYGGRYPRWKYRCQLDRGDFEPSLHYSVIELNEGVVAAEWRGKCARSDG